MISGLITLLAVAAAAPCTTATSDCTHFPARPAE